MRLHRQQGLGVAFGVLDGVVGVFGAAEVLEVGGGVVHQALVEAAEVRGGETEGIAAGEVVERSIHELPVEPVVVRDEPQTVPRDVEQPASEVLYLRGRFRERQSLLPPFLHQERHLGVPLRDSSAG